MQQYQISHFDPKDEEGFLSLVARRTGKLLKGGIPDRVAAGRTVLRDWNAGRIPYFTLPSETDKPEKDENVRVCERERERKFSLFCLADGVAYFVILLHFISQAVVLSNFSKEFNMDDILQFDEEVLDEAASEGEGTSMWTDISVSL